MNRKDYELLVMVASIFSGKEGYITHCLGQNKTKLCSKSAAVDTTWSWMSE